jgi:hypothetical protein
MALVPNEKRPMPDSYSALPGEIKERIRSAQYAALNWGIRLPSPPQRHSPLRAFVAYQATRQILRQSV